ncbi:MAG: outer membrane lipoprotein carrier protein LolA [Acidobacteria bacterium]|jgi:outer membrane lipoprotein-sorting protein|nr:outer membrane lipoprotein carrier protein LolA [Acidobacteriota bacterium]
MGLRRALVLLLPLLAATAGQAGTDPFLQRVRESILRSQPFRVDFVQQVTIDGEPALEESGVIVFADRQHVKWQYLDPEFKVFILEKDRYRFYDRENNQLLQGALGEHNERLIWELLLSDRPGGAARWDARKRTIRLRLDEGQGGEGAQELQVIVGPDFLPQRVEQAVENGVTTVYVFSNYRSRVALAAGEFLLDLPADVEVIEGQAP